MTTLCSSMVELIRPFKSTILCYGLFVCILLQEFHVHARCATVEIHYGPVSDREDDAVFLLGDGDHMTQMRKNQGLPRCLS